MEGRVASFWHGRRKGAIALLVASALLLPLWVCAPADAAAAKPIDEARTVPAGEYSWVLLYPGNPPQDMEINVTWNSSVAIDVWLMDRRQWDRYEAGLNFSYDIAQSGVLGNIRFKADAARMTNGSMYVVLDNTDRGPTSPPLASPQYTADVTVRGETWHPDPIYTPDPNAGLWLAAIAGVAMGLPLLLIVFVIVRRIRRRDRHKALGKDLREGRLVGRAQAPSRATVPAGPAYPQPPYGGPFAAPPFPTSTAARRCPSCGAPVAAHLEFCTQCGARA